jgi:hypothetical protein
MACCIYTCFSIACFSLFTVFPALIIYGLLCVEKERKHNFIAYLCLSFAVAILMALPVLFPALGAYTVSGRGGGLFENLSKGYTLNSKTSSPEIFNSSTFIDSYSQSVYRKWSYILSDSIFVVLTLVWFYRKGLKDGFAKFMLVAGVLTLLPTVVDESMNLLNMGSYMSYALRFGFLNALYFLGGACLCLESICYKPLHAFDGKPLVKLSEEETPTTETVCVEEGEKKNEGGMVATKEVPASAPAPVKVEEKPVVMEETPEEYADYDVPPDMDVPPDETEMGGSVYMDAPIVEEQPKVEPKKPVQTEAPKAVKAAPTGDARATFGLFLRSIRKTAKNGVLIALCMDLDSAYEDGVFVLYTSSDTVYRSLKKQDHFVLIEQAFAAIGIATDGFDIRLKGKKADAFNAGVNEIQDTFGGVKIDVK